MNRRSFFATLAGMAAAAQDPERLLWVPGRKKIFIPATRAEPDIYHFTGNGVVTFAGIYEYDRATGLHLPAPQTFTVSGGNPAARQLYAEAMAFMPRAFRKAGEGIYTVVPFPGSARE